jgi:hypothetical protein
MPIVHFSLEDPTAKALLNTYLIEMIVDCALPFSLVERPSFKRVVSLLRPGTESTLLGRLTFSGRILQERYAEAIVRRDANIEKLQQRGNYIGLLVDGWQTSSKKSLEGVMLKAGATNFLLAAVEPGTDHHGIALARMWEGILSTEAAPYATHLRYLLSVDAGQCGKARRILALRRPGMLWLKCWAHQVNLMVGRLLRQTAFAGAASDAVTTATVVRRSSVV